MITIQLSNSVPYPDYTGMTVKIQKDSLPTIDSPNENTFCYCKYECEYVEKVFGLVGSSDYWKNDKNTFIYRRLITTDSIVIKLLKNDVEIATINDNTYGDYINGYASGTSEQQLYVVFTIHWQNVLSSFGGGEYKIKAEKNILGIISDEISRKFKLYSYSDANANGTVLVESYINGNIIGSDFDFTALNLYQSFRLQGKLTEITPELEDDSYQTNDYEIEQIQTKLIPKWLLKTKRVPRAISLLLTKHTILANEILITDYNIINEDIFRRISLYPENINKTDIGRTTRPIFEFNFREKIDNFIKRNF